MAMPHLRSYLVWSSVFCTALSATAAPVAKGHRRRKAPPVMTAEPQAISAPTEFSPAPPPAEPARSTPRAAPPAAAPPAAAPPAAAPPATSPSATTPIVAALAPKLEVGAGIIVYAYLPTLAGVDNNLELYFANLLLDGTYGRFGMHIEPRLRDTKLRPYFASTVWLEEAYAYVDLNPVVIKVGKEYSRLGLFWDNSFYGNIQSFDGLKLDPDAGVSVEGRVGTGFGLTFWAQFFLMDGRTNISLDGRDTISIPGAARRNQAVLRLEPFVRLGAQSTFKLGVSGEYFRADLPDDPEDVVRVGVDASIVVHNWQAWAEFMVQQGRSVTDFPYPAIPATATAAEVPGRASLHNEYWLVGTDYTYRFMVARYNFSLARYSSFGVTEWIQQPGFGIIFNSQISALAEYVLWKRFATEARSTVDSSVNVTVSAHW
jgi:hypothetical protein